jgi:hypothetical protein
MESGASGHASAPNGSDFLGTCGNNRLVGIEYFSRVLRVGETGRAHPVFSLRQMRKFIIALSALGLVAGSAPSLAAAPCRDAKGKFVKCTKPAPAKPTRCKDTKGKFAKCGTPGAKPA